MQTTKRIRFIPNKYNPNDFKLSEITSLIQTKLNDLKQNMSPPDQKYKIYSNGKQKKDYTIYTGTSGNIYTYWRQYILTKTNSNYSNLFDESLQSFVNAYNTNMKIFKDSAKENKFDYSTSFFQGPVGLFTLGCVLAKEIDDKKLFVENLNEVLSFKQVAISKYSEDELLYGNSGYLYSLLLIQSEFSGSFSFDISKDIYEVTMFLYKIGLEKQKKHKTEFLLFPFPRDDKDASLYLGGAHGVIGALYVLLCAVAMFPETFKAETSFKASLVSSIDGLLKLQFDSGNFPSNASKLEKDELVHFCHGAIGAVYLYSLAYDVYKDERYLKSVLAAGETIWERGLLLKGNGVCHGISGITYCFNRIFVLTKDDSWRQKMLCFLYATVDEEIQIQVRECVDPQRYVKGMPDTPYSLMEGLGGQLCLYYDFLSGDDYMKFPGFQIL
jgi:hypothetical protein